MTENPLTRIITPMRADLLASIDGYRRTQHPLPSRSEAIRQLIMRGLAMAAPPVPDAEGFRMSDDVAERVENIRRAYGVSEDAMIAKLLEHGLAAAERGLKS